MEINGIYRSALKGTNGWTRVSVQFTTKSTTNAVRISVRRRGGNGTNTISGTAWWDGIRLYNQSETTAYSGKPRRYVSVDFPAEQGASAVSAVARRGAGGAVVTGAAAISDVKIRRLTPGNIGAVPYLSVNASKSQDGSKVYLMVVNKNMTAAISPTVSLVGDTVYSAKSWTLNGPFSYNTNEGAIPEVIVEEGNLVQVSNGFTHTFPAHSLTALEIDLDTDGDGVPNASDNCPTVANPNQADSNANGVGDACDSVDLNLTVTDSPDPVLVNDNIIYTLTVTNNGSSSASAVSLTDYLPAGSSWISTVATQGICTNGSTVTCNLGSLANGATATVTIAAKATTAGTPTNTATVSNVEFDPAGGNNTATAATIVLGSCTGTSGYKISGKTKRANKSVIPSVTIDLRGPGCGDRTTTDSTGYYGFTKLANGTYSVTPYKSGCTSFTPMSKPVTISWGNKTGQNFTGVCPVNN